MSMSVRIREATLDDNEGLIDLVRRCPLPGPIHVALDRGPDYFAFVRLQGPRSQIFVAETLVGEVVGCMVLVESDDDPESGQRVLRLADLRTDPAYRHARVAVALLDRYRERLLDEGFAYGLTETNQLKAPPRKTQRLLGDKVEVRSEGTYHVYHVPPIMPYRIPAAYRARPAALADLTQISYLLQSQYGHTLGRPSFAQDWLLETTEKHCSFGLQHLWVIENLKGEVLACAGVWDQRQLRQTLAVRFGRFVKFFVRLLALVGLVWRVPPLPALGRPLRYAYLRWPAARVGEEKALGILIRHLLHLMREEGDYQFLAIGLPDGDRLLRSVRGLIRFSTRIALYSHRVKRDPGMREVLPVESTLRPYVDASLLS